MKRKIFFIVLLAVAFSLFPNHSIAQPLQKNAFSIGSESFMVNGKPFVIRCGEMHFARIPKAYWRQRLKMAKAMGLNTICEYLFWNLHEPVPGKFNWNDQADAAEFCKIAREEGLYVVLRPGPYSCAEWDFGGFPWWLLKKKDIALRTQDPYYLERCRQYLKEVGRVLAPLQIDKGGPILMVQVENEYGSYGSDKEYIGKLKNYLQEAGFSVPLFTCDGPSQLIRDVRSDIFSVVNFGDNPESAFKSLREVRPTGPLMCGEYYPGWFDSWGGKHQTGTSDRIVKEIGWMLDHKASFSIYMVHGGTTFGLWSGANSPPYSPQTSSYDYDAPINEQGAATPKYYDLRNLLKQYLLPGEILTEVPSPMPVQSVAVFGFTKIASIMDQLKKPIFSDTTLYMEDLNQAYGAVFYETTLKAGPKGMLDLKEVHDYAMVYLGNELIGTLDRRKDEHLLELPVRSSNKLLRIFVEATGRVNYGKFLHDRKGLQNEVYLNENGVNKQLHGWKHYSVTLENNASPQYLFSQIKPDQINHGPAFYKAEFTVDKLADTFLDLRHFQKGVVWLNGHCLGRYWNIGPTQTMFAPGVWMKKGKNEVVVMDLFKPVSLTMQGLTLPILDSPK